MEVKGKWFLGPSWWGLLAEMLSYRPDVWFECHYLPKYLEGK